LEKVVSNENDAVNILLEAANLNEGTGTLSALPTAADLMSTAESSHASSITVRYTVSPLTNINSLDLESLRVWDGCRFVRMGWLTAHEAMTLVDL
jgi:hypothetical protein